MSRILHLAGLFDLDADDLDGRPPVARTPLALPARGITLITGPSGSGKSTLLRATRDDLAARRETIIVDHASLDPFDAARCAAVEAFDGSLESALATLNRAGLADAKALARPVATLSVGQRARFDLARLVHRAMEITRDSSTTAVVMIDEFLAPLDRLTARAIALGFRRWIDRLGRPIVLLVATAHDDLTAALAPEVHVHLDLDGRADRRERANADPPDEAIALGGTLRIERGTIHDFDRLAHHHYRGGRPATITQVHRAVFTPTDEPAAPILAGVLVVSHPPLDARARRLALGDRYRDLPAGLRGRAVNREVRTISRVVIEPRFRGLGIAARLVRTALAHAETPCTEAFATMGRLHPFFERAGMQRFEPPPNPTAARFIAVLRAVNIEPALIAASARFDAALRDLPPAHGATVEREMHRLAPGVDEPTRLAKCRSAIFGPPAYFLACRD